MDCMDVIIPTCKLRCDVQPLVQEIETTAGRPVRLIATCRAVCAAKNRNLGLEASRSELVVMLDDDITGLPQGWVKVLAEVMESQAKCVMCSPQLINPDGSYALMMGCPQGRPPGSGCRAVCGPHLLTACIIIRRDELRFDETFVGSGWEDNEYCDQQDARYPGCVRLVNHDVQVVHLNEMKNQREHFERNRAHYNATRRNRG